MDNLFRPATNDELKKLYAQYTVWNKTGVLIPGTELSKMSDYYIDGVPGSWAIVLSLHLLEEIANRWVHS